MLFFARSTHVGTRQGTAPPTTRDAAASVSQGSKGEAPIFVKGFHVIINNYSIKISRYDHLTISRK